MNRIFGVHVIAANDSKSFSAALEELKPFLDRCDDDIKTAVSRFLERSPCWSTELSGNDLHFVVLLFTQASYRGPWERKSLAKQRKWGVEFKETMSKLYRLLETGPYSPQVWGLPIRGPALAKIQAAIGNESDRLDWTILDALKAYEDAVEKAAEPDQPLAKPGDAKAARAQFLHQLSSHCPHIKAETLAEIASLLFGEQVDERMARKRRKGHAGRIKKNSA